MAEFLPQQQSPLPKFRDGMACVMQLFCHRADQKKSTLYVQRWSRLLLRWMAWRLWLYSHVNVWVIGLPSKVPISRNWLDCHSYLNIGCGCGATNRHMLNPCSIEWWINASAHRTKPKDLLCSPVRIERDWSLVSITLIAVGAQKNVHCTSA